jgi:hypothetical protein
MGKSVGLRLNHSADEFVDNIVVCFVGYLA